MLDTQQNLFRTLRLFITGEYPCSYLPDRLARSLVADPESIDNKVYSRLAKLGFRRSGNHVYSPHCTNCKQCLSLRIPVLAFQPNRAQRRIWNRNQDLDFQSTVPKFSLAHYSLFKCYLKTRHPDGGMNDITPESYLAFIASHWSNTRLYEFRQRDQLLAVAVTDRLADGLSAVYTFFDPEQAKRSLGTHAILWQINEARHQGLPWVYLGYWVRTSRKMAYKTNFQPHQILVAGHWIYPPRQAV